MTKSNLTGRNLSVHEVYVIDPHRVNSVKKKNIWYVIWSIKETYERNKNIREKSGFMKNENNSSTQKVRGRLKRNKIYDQVKPYQF